MISRTVSSGSFFATAEDYPPRVIQPSAPQRYTYRRNVEDSAVRIRADEAVVFGMGGRASL